MPVQMIELEEVQMNEASDADLEAAVEAGNSFNCSNQQPLFY